MSGRDPIPGGPDLLFEGGGLLSVDVDAQLRKLPGRRNLSRHHWPVELVRGALARGAGTVSVSVSGRRVEVCDDGAPPSPGVLDSLVTAFDATRPDGERTAALELFEDGQGLDLLSAFAPSPSQVEIHCGAERGSRLIAFRTGESPVDRLLSPERVGTRVTVCRRGNPRREREAVVEQCRFAGAHITLDGRTVSPGQPPEALAATRVAPAFEHGPGVLWIPASGDVCRVRMLRNGIVSRQAALPARLGFLFHAALEGDELPSGAALEKLRLLAEQQYGLLARRLGSLEPRQQERTDELLFLLYRRGGESELVLSYAPFRLRGRDERLSLAEVRELDRLGPLLAVRAGSLQDRERKGGGDKVLALTTRQQEFLVTDVGVKVLEPPRPDKGLVQWLVRAGQRLVDRISGRLSANGRVVPEDLLTQGERVFIDAVSRHLDQSRQSMPAPDSVVFLDAAGRRCWTIEVKGGGRRLGIHRRHSLVRSAVAAYGRDPANLRLFLPLLDEGLD